MNFHLDCIPCFFRQALFSSREAGAVRETQREILNELAALIPRLSLEASPPENSLCLYEIVHRRLGNDNPYREIKNESNRIALSVYPELAKRVKESPKPFYAALETAIAGNIIDYGAGQALDLPRLIDDILRGPGLLPAERTANFQPDGFLRDLEDLAARGGRLLYIGDNAGEIVFDRIFIEYLLESWPGLEIRYAVRGRPIINDVTLEDAAAAGMDTVCRCISSGSPAPGTVLSLCSPEFLKTLEETDIVIAKGQGNYESLSGQGYPVYFLLRVKCPVLSEAIPAPLGSVCVFREQSGEGA